MVVECDVRLLSLYGYLEFVDGKLELFCTSQGRVEVETKTAPARLHICPEGIMILGMPPKALEHIKAAFVDTKEKTPEKTISVRISTTGV